MKRSEKSTCPSSWPIGGIITLSTRALTTLPNAAPMMTPTAMSTTLPLSANSRNSFSTTGSLLSALDRAWRRSYPIEMLRLRPRSALLLLALLALGFASAAGATLASQGCCGMGAQAAATQPEAPCASLAPAACCEERLPAASPRPEPAPALALALAPAPEPAPARAGAAHACAPPAPAQRPLATVVLRL